MDVSVPVVVLKTARGAFHHGTLCLARSLGRLGVPIYTFQDAVWSPTALSRYVRKTLTWNFESHTELESVNHLLQVGRVIGRRPILIPTDDIGAILVADHAEALRDEFCFPEQPAGLTRALASKKELFLLCSKVGVPAPPTAFPGTLEEVHDFLKVGSFPVVVKSIDARFIPWHRGGQSVFIARDRTELLDYYRLVEQLDHPNLMLQEYIPGGSDSIWMFDGYFNAQSDCLAAFTGQKIRQYPPYTGPTSLGICRRNIFVENAARTFLKGIGYRGIVDMGYRYDARDGSYRLLDVNPRIGATFRLFAGTNDLDVARALYLDLTHQSTPSTALSEDRRWVVENYDALSAVEYGRDGQLDFAEWVRSFRGVKEGAWFARDDLLPFLAMSAGFPLKLIRASIKHHLRH